MTSAKTPGAITAPRKSRFKQIAAYVSAEEHEAFLIYAASLGVSASTLLNLLVRRELHLNRLKMLLGSYPEVTATSSKKIIAHLEDNLLTVSFSQHARNLLLTISSAGGALIRTELSEQWLAEALFRVLG